FSRASMEGESCSQIIIRDQSNSKELEKQLHMLSKQDLLTNLYNRPHFLEQVSNLLSLSVEGKAQGAVMFISIDKFESIRDMVDIAGADLLLADVADIMKEKLGEAAILARYEGPLFSLLINGKASEDAEDIAGKLCQLIRDHTSDINGKMINPTASIGIMYVNETISNTLECISRAEKGYQAAENAGGNQYFVYNPAVEELAEKEQVTQWSQLIKDALKNNDFHLLFQPIVSLHGEPGAHFDVFVRMLDQKGNTILPSDFMPAADQADLTKYIDRWVLANIFKLLIDRNKQGMSTRFFVKVSENSLIDPEFIPWVSERIKALRLKADDLVFQLNEETALNHIKPARALVDSLKQLNCRTALENFGIEQNTFQSLKQLKVDYIKLHYKLIHNLGQNVENQEKVKEITDMTSGQNIITIASFVEDANSLAMLWQCSVDFIEGHFLQHPDKSLDYNFDEAF
ncbi:MAG: EAL domain-containing protein, partial [Gammaproteobacteria bacterium]|nr:EAL domain-containing protein [Gammaproteobacteria bacterium]